MIRWALAIIGGICMGLGLDSSLVMFVVGFIFLALAVGEDGALLSRRGKDSPYDEGEHFVYWNLYGGGKRK